MMRTAFPTTASITALLVVAAASTAVADDVYVVLRLETSLGVPVEVEHPKLVFGGPVAHEPTSYDEANDLYIWELTGINVPSTELVTMRLPNKSGDMCAAFDKPYDLVYSLDETEWTLSTKSTAGGITGVSTCPIENMCCFESADPPVGGVATIVTDYYGAGCILPCE